MKFAKTIEPPRGMDMSTIFWIHCNKCIVRYGPNVDIFLMECGHLLCGNCLHENGANVKKCLVCNKNVSRVKLGNTMDRSVKDFFIPPAMHLKRVMQVFTFEQQHSNALIKRLTAKNQEQKKQFEELVKKLRAENADLKAYIRSHGGRGSSSRRIPTSTPSMPYSGQHFVTPGHSNISSIQRVPRETPRHPAMPGLSHHRLNEASNSGGSSWSRRVTPVPTMLRGGGAGPPPNYPMRATRFAPSTMIPLHQLQRGSSGFSSVLQPRK